MKIIKKVVIAVVLAVQVGRGTHARLSGCPKCVGVAQVCNQECGPDHACVVIIPSDPVPEEKCSKCPEFVECHEIKMHQLSQPKKQIDRSQSNEAEN